MFNCNCNQPFRKPTVQHGINRFANRSTERSLSCTKLQAMENHMKHYGSTNLS